MDYEVLTAWLTQYGSVALFFLLVSGIVILPIPEETLMVVAGVLMSQGILNTPSTLVAAYGGSICGITTSYLLGLTIGHFLIIKYGKWIGMTQSRLDKAHNWFEKFGKWTLIVGYFIPGVRHFTGFVSGTTEMQYKHFALFAYTGAVLWVTTFISIGYFCGNYCFEKFSKLESLDLNSTLTVFLALILIFLGYRYFIKKG